MLLNHTTKGNKLLMCPTHVEACVFSSEYCQRWLVMSETVPRHGSFAMLLCTTCQSSRLFPSSKVMKQPSPWWQEAGLGGAPMHDCAEPKIARLFTDAVTALFPGILFFLPSSSSSSTTAFDTVERWLRTIVSTKTTVKYEHWLHQWDACETKTMELVSAVSGNTISLAFQTNNRIEKLNSLSLKHVQWN